jgi:phosphoribosylamine---glycine ligase
VKILLIDHDAVALAFALRCLKAGHAVRWFIKQKESNNQQVGDGFKGLEKVDNWVTSLKWADLVWCSSNDDYLPKLDAVRKTGIKVFAPTEKSAALEIKRSEGMRFFEKCRVDVPEYEQFKTLSEAEAHVRKTGKRYVFKTLGDNEDKSLSYVSKTPADMIARLKRWQKLNMNPKGPVMLQEFIPGIEFAVSGWMGTNGFLQHLNENFENKKLLSGDCGPNCGEAGTVMKYVQSSSLAESVLYPLEEALVRLGHLGDVDVNCIIDESGKAWPLEFTCRPGWPAFNIMLSEHKGDPAQWMLDACNGKDTLEVSPQVACGLVIAIPDYPYSNKTRAERSDIPVYGITDKNRAFVAPQSIKMAKHPVMEGEKVVEKDIWSSADDYLCVVTGMGKTVKRACDRAYATLKELHVPDMMYRDDIGERLEKTLPELHDFGYATEFEYS